MCGLEEKDIQSGLEFVFAGKKRNACMNTTMGINLEQWELTEYTVPTCVWTLVMLIFYG